MGKNRPLGWIINAEENCHRKAPAAIHNVSRLIKW